MRELRDEFLSEEDLDLQNLTYAELLGYWNLWLRQAQDTNELDAAEYSHGVFDRDPEPLPTPENVSRPGPFGPLRVRRKE